MIKPLYKSRINWTDQEEQFLKQLREILMIKSWKTIAEKINQKFLQKRRSGKQCRERYTNYLKFSEDIHQLVEWELDEDLQLFNNFMGLGSKWSKIAEMMSGRSENNIKNRFHCLLRKLSRKIKKCEKQLKKRHRKHLKYETLVQVLEFSKKQGSEVLENGQSKDQNQRFLQNLARMITQHAIERGEKSKNETVRLVQLIHRYVAIKKEIKKGRIAKQADLPHKSAIRANSVENNRQESNKQKIIETTDLQANMFSLQEIERISCKKKIEESLFNVLSHEPSQEPLLAKADFFY